MAISYRQRRQSPPRCHRPRHDRLQKGRARRSRRRHADKAAEIAPRQSSAGQDGRPHPTSEFHRGAQVSAGHRRRPTDPRAPWSRSTPRPTSPPRTKSLRRHDRQGPGRPLALEQAPRATSPSPTTMRGRHGRAVRLTTKRERAVRLQGVVYDGAGKTGCVGGYAHFTGKTGVLIQLDTDGETPIRRADQGPLRCTSPP